MLCRQRVSMPPVLAAVVPAVVVVVHNIVAFERMKNLRLERRSNKARKCKQPQFISTTVYATVYKSNWASAFLNWLLTSHAVICLRNLNGCVYICVYCCITIRYKRLTCGASFPIRPNFAAIWIEK